MPNPQEPGGVIFSAEAADRIAAATRQVEGSPQNESVHRAAPPRINSPGIFWARVTGPVQAGGVWPATITRRDPEFNINHDYGQAFVRTLNGEQNLYIAELSKQILYPVRPAGQTFDPNTGAPQQLYDVIAPGLFTGNSRGESAGVSISPTCAITADNSSGLVFSGGNISNQSIELTVLAASQTQWGVVTTGEQEIAGQKDFDGASLPYVYQLTIGGGKPAMTYCTDPSGNCVTSPRSALNAPIQVSPLGNYAIAYGFGTDYFASAGQQGDTGFIFPSYFLGNFTIIAEVRHYFVGGGGISSFHAGRTVVQATAPHFSVIGASGNAGCPADSGGPVNGVAGVWYNGSLRSGATGTDPAGNLVAGGFVIGLGANPAFTVVDGPPPVSHTATGTLGQCIYNGGYLYLCVATNTWGRVLLDFGF